MTAPTEEEPTEECVPVLTHLHRHFGFEEHMLGFEEPIIVPARRWNATAIAGWSVALLELSLLLIVASGWHDRTVPPVTATAIAGTTKHIYIIRHGEKFAADSGMPYENDYACLSEKGWARAYNLKSIFGKSGWLPAPDALYSANYFDSDECRDEHGWYRTQQTLSALAQSAPGGLSLPIDNSTGFNPQLCGSKVHPSSPWADAVPAALVSESGTCFPYGMCGTQKWGNGSRPCPDANAGMCCNLAAAHAMLARLAEPGVDTLLVAWESVNTVWLARALGVQLVSKWDYHQSEFDRIYALTYELADDLADDLVASAERLRLVRFETLQQGFDNLGNGRAPSDALRWLGPQSGCGKVQVRDLGGIQL